MPPRKRKAAADTPAAGSTVHVDAQALKAIEERLKVIDAAVEERCEAIMAAALDAAAKIRHEVNFRLMGMPKKVKSTAYTEYLQTVEQPADAGPKAAAAAVDSKLAQLHEHSEAAATAAPTTRSLRSRSRAATAAAAEPRTVRVTRARQPVPKFNDSSAVEPAATKAADPAAEEPQTQTAAAATMPAGTEAAVAQTAEAMPPESSTPPAHGRARGRGRAAAAALPAVPETPTDDAQQEPAPAAGAPGARRASIVSRVEARVDERLARLGLAAGTAARGARTAMRAAAPGEACFSKNGSPLSIHPNVTRNRGRTAAGWALMTPAVAAAAGEVAGPNGAMLGCFTLVKKGGAAGVAAATGRAGRSTAATKQPETGNDTAMVITADDGTTFTIDAAAGGLSAVPVSHRQDVEAKLRALQQLAATALGM